MVYESSYESGQKPFLPDPKRGYWASPNDFLYACWGVAFKMEVFSMSWYYFFEMGIFTIIPYLICMALYVVPIILIQSFLGQFSSSGYVSAFRIAPLFKGMGYISLALNFSILTYFSVYAAIPLMYFFNSLRPTLPWSCEAFEKWSKEVPSNGEINYCTNSTMEHITTTTMSSNDMNSSESSYDYMYHTYHIPSVAYFRSLFDYKFGSQEYESFYISWQLVLCMLLVWTGIAFIFYKIITTEMMGKLIRYSVWSLCALMLVCLSRLIFLTDAKEALAEFFVPRHIHPFMGITSIPIFTLASFGSGWGNIVSLASYNKFKTNVMRYSWFISLGHLLVLVLFGLIAFLMDRHFVIMTSSSYYSFSMEHWVMYLSSASALASIELANMWSLLFHGLLVMCAMLIIVIQFFSLLTAIFDEFEYLRPRRQEVIFVLIGLLAFCSLYFCSNHGLTNFTALPADALFTQTVLNLLLLLVVLWIYGRVRFQRDLEFMLGARFASWRVFILRFIAPLALLLTMLMGFMIAYYEHFLSSIVVGVMAIFLIGIPWLFVPGYAAFSLFRASGTLSKRFLRCSRPTDWYPVDPEDRQRYEEAMGNMDITHQLNEVGGDDVL